MYIAKTHVGTYRKGECIADGVLNEEQIAWLISVGAIEEIAPAAKKTTDAATNGNTGEDPVEDAPAKKTTRRKRKGVKADESADA